MTNYLRDQKNELKRNLREYIKAENEKIESGNYTEHDLERDIREFRNTERPLSFMLWKKVHANNGVRATWKDDRFFTYMYKEFTRKRTFPWVVAAASWFGFCYALPHPTDDELKQSPNFYPYGSPPGSKLNDHYQHLVHEIEDPPNK